jgi:hypothetical protein
VILMRRIRQRQFPRSRSFVTLGQRVTRVSEENALPYSLRSPRNVDRVYLIPMPNSTIVNALAIIASFAV